MRYLIFFAFFSLNVWSANTEVASVDVEEIELITPEKTAPPHRSLCRIFTDKFCQRGLTYLFILSKTALDIATIWTAFDHKCATEQFGNAIANLPDSKTLDDLKMIAGYNNSYDITIILIGFGTFALNVAVFRDYMKTIESHFTKTNNLLMVYSCAVTFIGLIPEMMNFRNVDKIEPYNTLPLPITNAFDHMAKKWPAVIITQALATSELCIAFMCACKTALANSP